VCVCGCVSVVCVSGVCGVCVCVVCVCVCCVCVSVSVCGVCMSVSVCECGVWVWCVGVVCVYVCVVCVVCVCVCVCRRSIPSFFLYLGTRLRRLVLHTWRPDAMLTQKEPPVTVQYETGLALKSTWTLMRGEMFVFLVVSRITDRPHCS